MNFRISQKFKTLLKAIFKDHSRNFKNNPKLFSYPNTLKIFSHFLRNFTILISKCPLNYLKNTTDICLPESYSYTTGLQNTLEPSPAMKKTTGPDLSTSSHQLHQLPTPFHIIAKYSKLTETTSSPLL